MKTLTISSVLALGLLACNRAPEPKAPTREMYALAPLTTASQAHSERNSFTTGAVSLPTIHSARSAWAQAQIDWFEKKEYSPRREAYQRMWAWGAGTYRGEDVEWFAWSNTDALVFINLSTKLTDSDLDKVREVRESGRESMLPSNWRATVDAAYDTGPGTGTQITTDNDWPTDHPGTDIDAYINALNYHMGPVLDIGITELLK